MMCDDIDASLCVEGRCIIIVSDCLPCVHTRNSDNNTQWSPSLFLSGTNPIRSLPWHWSPLLSLSKHQIQLSLNTSPTEVPHHCMGLLHTTYFIPKKKMWKNLYFFGKDWVWRVRDGRKVMVGDHHLLSPFLLGRGELESRCASITHPWWIAGDVICYSPSLKKGWWKHTYYDHLLSSSQGRVTPGDTSPTINYIIYHHI